MQKMHLVYVYFALHACWLLRYFSFREGILSMKYNVNWSLFEGTKHGPAFVELQAAAGKKEMHDFSVPVNPYFMSGDVLKEFYSQLPQFLKFYPSSNVSVSQNLGKFLSIDPDNLVMANGSTELITWIDHLFVKESILTDVPTFGRWTDQSYSTGKKVELYFRSKENNFKLVARLKKVDIEGRKKYVYKSRYGRSS